jgi:hypothetical protein
MHRNTFARYPLWTSKITTCDEEKGIANEAPLAGEVTVYKTFHE